MKNINFEERLETLKAEHEILIKRLNEKEKAAGNGVFHRYKNPVLTAAHTPLTWRYDLNKDGNPRLMERIGINAVFNAGAIYFNNKYLLVARVEVY